MSQPFKFKEFKTFVNYISVFADFTIDPFLNRSNTVRMTSRTPKITAGTATLSAAGAVSFAEINQGGIQIVTSATKLVRSDFNSSDAFSVTGSLSATGNITAFSDERLKDDIETLDGSKVLDMRGVSYTKDGKAGSGVIAQELEKVAPELVMTNEKEDGMKSVAYGNLVGYLIEAVKDQQKQIDELKAQINDISN